MLITYCVLQTDCSAILHDAKHFKAFDLLKLHLAIGSTNYGLCLFIVVSVKSVFHCAITILITYCVLQTDCSNTP